MPVNDRWIWLGLGAFTFLAIRGISYGLREVYRLTEVTEKVKKTRRVSQETEDSIKLESLQTLATCSNADIRKAATKILCDRFVHHPTTLPLLASDLVSRDPGTRARAYRALRFLDCHTGSTDWRAPPPPRRQHQRQQQQHQQSHRRLTSRAGVDLSQLIGRDGGAASAAWFRNGGAARRPAETVEERALRRRRREAFVLNEGDRPVSQDDIVQPPPALSSRPSGGGGGEEEDDEGDRRRSVGAIGPDVAGPGGRRRPASEQDAENRAWVAQMIRNLASLEDGVPDVIGNSPPTDEEHEGLGVETLL